MELLLDRIAKKAKYTIGRFYINNKYFCDTLEDPDRGLSSDMPIEELKKKKMSHITAVPTGRYRVVLSIISPKFSKYAFYKQFNRGRVPRLLNVPAFDGVLIHCGNTAEDTDGCLIVGKNTKVGMVLDSKITYAKLYPLLEAADKKKEEIWITVK